MATYWCELPSSWPTWVLIAALSVSLRSMTGSLGWWGVARVWHTTAWARPPRRGTWAGDGPAIIRKRQACRKPELVGVAADDLPAPHGPQATPGVAVDGVLDELHRPVAEQGVDPAGVVA